MRRRNKLYQLKTDVSNRPYILYENTKREKVIQKQKYFKNCGVETYIEIKELRKGGDFEW